MRRRKSRVRGARLGHVGRREEETRSMERVSTRPRGREEEHAGDHKKVDDAVSSDATGNGARRPGEASLSSRPRRGAAEELTASAGGNAQTRPDVEGSRFIAKTRHFAASLLMRCEPPQVATSRRALGSA